MVLGALVASSSKAVAGGFECRRFMAQWGECGAPSERKKSQSLDALWNRVSKQTTGGRIDEERGERAKRQKTDPTEVMFRIIKWR